MKISLLPVLGLLATNAESRRMIGPSIDCIDSRVASNCQSNFKRCVQEISDCSNGVYCAKWPGIETWTTQDGKIVKTESSCDVSIEPTRGRPRSCFSSDESSKGQLPWFKKTEKETWVYNPTYECSGDQVCESYKEDKYYS